MNTGKKCTILFCDNSKKRLGQIPKIVIRQLISFIFVEAAWPSG